ncbi:MAG: glycosyltransferase [Planctomycetota bacterium]|jgi:O-antigen/teichoic acid export membrane protein
MRTETRHSIVLLAGTGITVVLSLAYSVYAQRVLGPVQAADFVAALSLVALCQIALGPINGTVTRFTAQFASHGQYGKVRTLSREITKRVALYVLVGVAVGLVLVKGVAGLLQFQSVTPLLVAYGMIYVTLLLSVSRGVLRGLQAFAQLNVNTILEAAVRLAVGLALLEFLGVASAGLSAYLIALILTLAISYLQMSRARAAHDRLGSRTHTPVENRCHTESSPNTESVDGRAVLRFTGPMFLMMITSAGFQNIDMLMVKHYFGGTDAGIYGAAFVLARSIGALVTPFTTLLLPLMTTMHERGERIAGTFARVSGYFLALAAIPVVLFWLWSDRIIAVLYGPQFAGAASILLIVTIARLLGYLAHMIALAGAATNRFRFLYVARIAFADRSGHAHRAGRDSGADGWKCLREEAAARRANAHNGPRGLMMGIAVCVITYQRPQGLARLLEGLSRLTFGRHPPDLKCVVVDNDQAQSAREACDAVRPKFRWKLEYHVEPKRGIPFARNTAIRRAGEDADLLAFIDDDEVPEPGWLSELLRVMEECDADVVAGPVVPHFVETPPAWVIKGRFFDRRRWATGTRLDRAFTGNILFQRKVFDGMDTHFDGRTRQSPRSGCRPAASEAGGFWSVPSGSALRVPLSNWRCARWALRCCACLHPPGCTLLEAWSCSCRASSWANGGSSAVREACVMGWASSLAW